MFVIGRLPTRTRLYSWLFWVAITVLFLYERTYLIQKAGLPHFLECAVVRLGLLLGLCQFHRRVLWSHYFAHQRYWLYVGGLLTAVGTYLLLQNLYDHYLFRFVIGDQRGSGWRENLPYNLLSTSWYVLLTTLIDRTNRSLSVTEPVADIMAEAPATLCIKVGTQWVHVPVAHIQYAEGLKDYTILHTDSDRYVVKGSVGKLIDQLPSGQFVRIHKSYLVAWAHIQSVSATAVTLANRTLPLGRTYATEIRKQWQRVLPVL